MKTLFKIIGYILAIPVFMFLSIIGIIYTTIKHIRLKDYSFKKQFLPITKALAITFDQFANASAGELLTDTLIKKRKDGSLYTVAVKYGKYFHTISAVTGVNEQNKTLNKEKGKRFNAMLSLFLGDKHSIKAINRCINYKCHD